MSTVSDPKHGTAKYQVVESPKVTLYERVSSAGVSLLIHFGAIFLILSMILVASNLRLLNNVIPVAMTEGP